MNAIRARAKGTWSVAVVFAATSDLGFALALPASAKADQPVVCRIGSARFRADRPIGDARYSADGRRVVGYAGSTLYVWDANDGSLLRRIDTKLEPLDDPTKHDEKGLAFAVHPKESRVACGGTKDGGTRLQIWDFETGKAVAEKAGRCDALKVLAWTPDGKRLLERANVGWEKPTGWMLIVRDDTLAEVRAHDLPNDFGDWSTVMIALPGGRQAILWQSNREPAVYDLESGKAVRTLAYKASIPSDLCLSPDGKTLAATTTETIGLLDFPGGETRKPLPVLRRSWEKPRPLFAPDGKTVYVWDHRPIAYDVASGKEKWKATFRTVHTVRMRLCDVAPDGATLLARHGHALARLDAKTGTERDPADAPSVPTGLLWSPDGKTLLTRTAGHDRTWTAWDAASGKRLYDLRPTGHVKDDEWKMVPGLFYFGGGKEIAVCLDKSESAEHVGPKELLVFDAATGQYKRRLGEPLPDAVFRWMHPIGVDEAGATVLMQAFAISMGGEPRFATVRWDLAKRAKVQEWTVEGYRTEPPRHYAPYDVTLDIKYPEVGAAGKKADPATIRCYSLADGKLTHELRTEFGSVDPDRIQGNLLLGVGYDSTWIARANTIRYTPQPPFAYDLWDLPGRDKVRVFTLDQLSKVVLGPGGQYVVRVLDDHTLEIHEPFALKKAVAKVATPCRAERLEFSPDGRRVAVSLSDASVVVWDATPWRKQVDERLAQGVPADLIPLWDDLSKDAATGLRAARWLSAAGDKTVALLREKIAARKAPDAARVKQRIAELDSPLFETREKAEKDLRDLSNLAETHLREELRAGPSPEVRRRIENLLGSLEARKLTPAESREMRAVRVLEWMNTEAARRLLAKWAGGDPNATLTKAAEKASGH